jgi:hypothetical protein
LITRLRNEASGERDDSWPLDISETVIAPDQGPVSIKVYCCPTTTASTFAECLEEGTFTLHFLGFIEYETLGFCKRKEFGYRKCQIQPMRSAWRSALGLVDTRTAAIIRVRLQQRFPSRWLRAAYRHES